MKYRCGGREYDAAPGDARRLDDGSWLAGGKRVRVARTAAGIEAWCGGRLWRLERVESGRKKAGDAEEDIVSPMTGKVSKVLVREGQAVADGQVVAIVEAMKMEYRVVAPHAGTVTKVNVKDGQLVEMGQVLADVTAT